MVGMVLAAGLVLLTVGPAGAEETFTFYGSGWGHGIGMSQYGSYGLAQDGWGAKKILTHYYRQTDVRTRDAPADRYRIGLLQSRSRVTFTAVGGSIELVVGSRVAAHLRAGRSAEVVRRDGRYRVIVGDRRRSYATNGALIVKRSTGAVVSVSPWGSSVGRGRLELAAAGASSMHLVAVLGAEAYLRGIAEVPSSWPSAALQAQAIAARTYAFRKVAADPAQRRSGCACGLYGDTRDQYYVGWPKEAGPSGARWVDAVRATRKQIVTYGGKPIPTYYSSSSGGYTEDIENVWVGASSAPYLQGVCDPGDYLDANPNRTWSASLGAATVTSRLRSLTGNIGTVTGFSEYRLGDSGRVRTIRVKGTGGSKVVKGWDVRSALGLKDTRFRVNQDRNITGRLRRAYDELMCRPGLARADDVSITGGKYQVFETGRLYLNDGRNDVVWLRGPVLAEYLERGGHGSSLRLPVSLERTADDGWLGRFEGGTIRCTSSGVCSTT
jgi:stage II sporulation protein D